MKMQYVVLSSKPSTLRSLTGLDADEFEVLLRSSGTAWDNSDLAPFSIRRVRLCLDDNIKAIISGDIGITLDLVGGKAQRSIQ